MSEIRHGGAKRFLGDKLRALISGGVEPHARVLGQQLLELRQELEATELRLTHELRLLTNALGRDNWTMERIAALGSAQRDAIPQCRRELAALRESPEYEKLWNNPEPLVTGSDRDVQRRRTVDRAIHRFGAAPNL